MSRFLAGQAAKAVGGTLILGREDTGFTGISLDSRTREEELLFVPVIGEQTDAHRFICQAISNGASVVFTSRHRTEEEVRAAIESQCQTEPLWRERAQRAAWIAVEDTRLALQAFGAWCRKENPIPLVGVTGSVGKTTTREMVAAALSPRYQVYKTPGNSNSQVGVPITVSQIPPEAEIGVIELGMSEPGEMSRIAKVAQVDTALVTNIGVAHIGQLGSQERIREEKLHIQDGMRPEGALILNGEDPLLVQAPLPLDRRVIYYGFGSHCSCRGEALHLEQGYPVFEAVCGEERVKVRLQVMGSHMVLNALAALAVAGEYGVPMKEAAAALEQFRGFKGRQQILQAEGMTLIDDSYNASPVSMKAGLEVLCSMQTEGKRIAVLADMKELGEREKEFHREVGAFMAENSPELIFLYGELAAQIGEEYLRLGGRGEVIGAGSLEELSEALHGRAAAGDCILFKGSNSMKLSKVVETFQSNRG